MRGWPVIAIVVLLSGCSQPATPDDIAVAGPLPELETASLDFDAVLYPSGEPQCTPVCIGGGPVSHTFVIDDHERVTALRFDVSAEDETWGQPATAGPHEYVVRVLCDGCAEPIAEARGASPLVLEADAGLDWGQDLLIEASLTPATGPSFLASATLRIGGTVAVDVDPTMRAAGARLTEPIRVEALAGPCVLLVENGCTETPLHTVRLGPADRPLAVHATLDWHAATPATARLRVEARCAEDPSPIGDCPGHGTTVFEGTAPLAIDLDASRYPEATYVVLEITVAEPYRDIARQEFVLEGEYVHLGDGEPARDPT